MRCLTNPACFDVTGAGAAVQGATQLAGTALQVSAEEAARKTAENAGNNAAASIGRSGEAAQNYYNPYVAEGQNTLSNINNNMSLWGNINNGYTNQAEGVQNTAANNLTSLANNGITQQSIENTPGYQSILNLGEQGATNSAAARGLANSGAAEKGAVNYASTLADQTYQNLYNDQISSNNALLGAGQGFLSTNSADQGNITNTWNRENQLLNYGYNASGASAQNASNTAVNSNQEMMEGATGGVAAIAGQGNALASGLSNLGNTASQYATYNALLGGSSGGGTNSTYGGPNDFSGSGISAGSY